MTFGGIGAKSRLIGQITAYIGHLKRSAFLVEAFCGMGVVAEVAVDLGWNVCINERLHSAVITAGALLISAERAVFKNLDGCAKAIAKLNAAEPKYGFMWREYSPASRGACSP